MTRALMHRCHCSETALAIQHVVCGTCHSSSSAAQVAFVSSDDKTKTASVLPVQTYRLNSKDLKRLKRKLVQPSKARKIVKSLKDLNEDDHDSESDRPAPRGYSLPMLDNQSLTQLLSLSPASFLTEAGAKAGAFDLLAQGTGQLLDASGRSAPTDRMSIFLYWWGYEFTCPKPVMETLKQLRTIQSTVFQFLQAFAILQAPELVPFVRYIANYFDMEFNAIKAQDRGRGVVLAATWLLPMAIVPRPWDLQANGGKHMNSRSADDRST